MKKIISIISALALMTAPFTVYAEDITLNENEQPYSISYGDEHNERNTRIRATIRPSYTVTIPADVDVQFEALQTSFGKVELTSANLEPGKTVTVSLEANNALKNDVDPSVTIAYKITESGSETEYLSSTFSDAGDKTDLYINIEKSQWDAAKAGIYSDTLTFKVEYNGRAASEWEATAHVPTQQPT